MLNEVSCDYFNCEVNSKEERDHPRLTEFIRHSIFHKVDSCEPSHSQTYLRLAKAKLSPKLAAEVSTVGNKLAKLAVGNKWSDVSELFARVEKPYNYVELIKDTLDQMVETASVRFDSALLDAMLDIERLNGLSELDELVDPRAEVKRRISMSAVKEEYEKLLIAPCENYVKLFRLDVFGPAAHDQLLKKMGHIEEDKSPQADKDYYAAWTRFNVCELLLSDWDLNANLVRRVWAEMRNRRAQD